MASTYDITFYDSGARYGDVSVPSIGRIRMAKVKLGLDDLSPEDNIAQAHRIKTGLTGNANFPDPDPTLTDYGTLITTAETKVGAYDTAQSAADTALSARDDAIAALNLGTTSLGDYVQLKSKGDKTKIESSGILVRADAAPLTVTRVLDLVLSEGDDAGTLDIVWKPVKGAKSYEIWLTTGDPNVEANWALKQTSSKSSDRLTGLTSGAKAWARVRAIGGNNQKGPFSDPATKTVP